MKIVRGSRGRRDRESLDRINFHRNDIALMLEISFDEKKWMILLGKLQIHRLVRNVRHRNIGRNDIEFRIAKPNFSSTGQ